MDTIRAGREAILTPWGELTHLPVIQGDADIGKRMSEDELQKTITFCGGVFLPVDPELRAHVASRLDSKLLDPNGPIVTPEEIEKLVPNDIEAQLVLKEINVWKGVGRTSIGSFSADGFSARVDRGSLGLIQDSSEVISQTTPQKAPTESSKGHGNFRRFVREDVWPSAERECSEASVSTISYPGASTRKLSSLSLSRARSIFNSVPTGLQLQLLALVFLLLATFLVKLPWFCRELEAYRQKEAPVSPPIGAAENCWGQAKAIFPDRNGVFDARFRPTLEGPNWAIK
ncbi:hypothetical protein BD779DRAFT_1470042 [Infundibulicybe gibba]|nr:hypothetical protein BD779DRAFT_1470042 [Infundibulicybe gibba]